MTPQRTSAQVIRPAGMTPLEIIEQAVRMDATKANATMTRSERDVIRAAITEYMIVNDVSHTAFARTMGCSAATINQVRLGRYPSDDTAWLIKARDIMADNAAMAQMRKPSQVFADTRISWQIRAVCMRARSMPCIGKIVAPSGCGKSAALQHVAGQLRDRCVYIQAGAAANSAAGILRSIMRGLNIQVNSRSRTRSGIYEAIRDELSRRYDRGKNASTLIIIDESTQLSADGLNIVRNLHDDIDVRAAVVLADTARMEGELRSRRGFIGGYEQLTSRFGAVMIVRGDVEIPSEDVAAVAAGVLSSLGFDRALPNKSLKLLHNLAQQGGKLRNVVYRLHAVSQLAEAAGKRPTFSPAELDFAASLVGHDVQQQYDAPPFADESDHEPLSVAGSIREAV
jgi:DNA transposition AAA+ family ATPase